MVHPLSSSKIFNLICNTQLTQSVDFEDFHDNLSP